MTNLILIGPVPPGAEAELEADGELMATLRSAGTLRFTSHPVTSSEFAADIGDATVLLGAGPYPAACWATAGTLRLISVTATGYHMFVDVPAAHSAGIDIAYVPSYGSESVAEHALALVLALAKQIVVADSNVRAGAWRAIPRSVQLSGGVAGVVGLGPVGEHMVRLLGALGMEVLVWTRRQDPARLEGTNARYASLPELVATSDVVSVHLAHNAETDGLIDCHLLATAKPGAILVNTARAELIDESALEEQVRAGRIRAGVDVFRHEPPSADDPMLSLGHDVVLTPHFAFNTPQASRSLLLGAARNVAAWASKVPVNIASRQP